MFRAFLLYLTFAVSAPMALAGEAAERVVESAAANLAVGDFDAADLTQTLDTPRIVRFALGRHARTASEDELARFTSVFEAFLVDRFEENAHRFEGARIDVLGSVDRNPRDSVVKTRVSAPSGDPMTVRWRLLERGGDWRIVDVEVGGLWLAIEQRAQLSAILSRRGASLDDAAAALRGDRDFASASDDGIAKP